MRPNSACSTCRLRKKRCIVEASQPACVLCTAKKLPCDVSTSRDQSQPPPAVSSPSNGDSLLRFGAEQAPRSLAGSGSQVTTTHNTNLSFTEAFLNSPITDELIELYFSIIHNKQQLLFQRRLFLLQRKARVLPSYILFGIFALVARFSTNSFFANTPPCDRATPFLQEALMLYHQRPDAISIAALQGCILLEFDCFVEDRLDEASLLGAQAVRMALRLNLANDTDEEIIQNEIKRRLFWGTFTMDTWTSIRGRLPRQIAHQPTGLSLLDEDFFENLNPSQTEKMPDPHSAELRRTGIWNYIIALHEPYAEISQLLYDLVERPAFNYEIDQRVQRLSDQLHQRLTNLPTQYHCTKENIARFCDIGRDRELAVLHMIYHHQNQLLYYPFLCRSSLKSAQSDHRVETYVARCKSHAEALSELMWTVNSSPGSECLWSPLNGHLLVVASSVHLHSLLMDQDAWRERLVRKLLEQNFVMLLHFRKYWPTLRLSLSRLQAFHRSCRKGDRLAAFTMDAWMLRYLNDYDSVMHEREYPPAGSSSFSDPAGAGEDDEEVWPDVDFLHESPPSMMYT